jgi:hypothetical protein
VSRSAGTGEGSFQSVERFLATSAAQSLTMQAEYLHCPDTILGNPAFTKTAGAIHIFCLRRFILYVIT